MGKFRGRSASPVLMNKKMQERAATGRHQRRKAEKLKQKLEAKGYSFPEKLK